MSKLQSALRPVLAALHGCAIAAAMVCSVSAVADDSVAEAPSNLKLSGFVSIVGGSTFNGSLPSDYVANGYPTAYNGINCPCYITDYTNAGVYGNKFSIKPDSHAGVQMQYTFTPDLNFVGQVAVRGEDTTPNVQWAYFSYQLNPDLEVHVGRQRLPIYYYSLFQDVGYSYPWVNVPPEVYGWEVTNYDGASLRYTKTFGETTVTSSLFGGQEYVGHSKFFSLFDQGDTDVSWTSIAGADTEINRGPLTLRAVYLQSNVRYEDHVPNSASVLTLGTQKMFGLAANLDFDSWFVLSEYAKQIRYYTTPDYTQTSPSYTIGAGMRLGKWTPFVNWSSFWQHIGDPTIGAGDYKRASISLRYDVDASSDVKLQLDRSYDNTGNEFGSTNLVRIAYDRVF